MLFSSLDQIGPQVGFRTIIQAIEISDNLVRVAPELKIPFGAQIPGLRKGDVSVRADGALYDERTEQFASQAAGRDISNLPFLDFDIHAVCGRLEGKPVSPWPHANVGDIEKELEYILDLYSAMLERIWSYFGGRSHSAFERLALWILENGLGRTGPGNVFGAVFAAAQYGNRSLALRLLDELAAGWDQRVRVDDDNALAQQIGDEALESVGRARRMLTT
jgi:hypothetical protein